MHGCRQGFRKQFGIYASASEISTHPPKNGQGEISPVTRLRKPTLARRGFNFSRLTLENFCKLFRTQSMRKSSLASIHTRNICRFNSRTKSQKQANGNANSKIANMLEMRAATPPHPPRPLQGPSISSPHSHVLCTDRPPASGIVSARSISGESDRPLAREWRLSGQRASVAAICALWLLRIAPSGLTAGRPLCVSRTLKVRSATTRATLLPRLTTEDDYAPLAEPASDHSGEAPVLEVSDE